MWGDEWDTFVLSLSAVCKPGKERKVREKGAGGEGGWPDKGEEKRKRDKIGERR